MVLAVNAQSTHVLTGSAMHDITWSDGAPGKVAPADLVGDRVCVASDGRIRLYRIGERTLRSELDLALSFEVDRVYLSPSLRFVMARRADAGSLVIWDAQRSMVVLTLDAEAPHRQRPVAAFAKLGNEELLLCARKNSELEVHTLGGQPPVMSCECETFRFTKLVPLEHTTSVLALGHFAGETNDSLVVVDLNAVISAPSSVFDQFRRKTGVTDYALRLGGGPCGVGTFVAFRDPEQDETDEPEPDDPNASLYGFRGLYVRMVDGRIVSTIPWHGDNANVTTMAGGASWIAIDGGDRIHLVCRDSSGAVRTEFGRWRAASRTGARVLVERGETWSLLDL